MAKTKRSKGVKKPEYSSNWFIYLIIAVIIIIIFGFILKNRLVGGLTSQLIKPTFTPIITSIPTLNIIRSQELGLSEQEYTDKAIADLAQKIKIAPDKIKLLKIKSEKWSNTSLGCPERGRFYSEVITPGYIIELSAKEKTWEYHAGLNKVVICTKN